MRDLPGDDHSLNFSHIQFHPRKVTLLTNHARDTAEGLCNCSFIRLAVLQQLT